MTNQTPLNPDALEAAKDAFDHAMGLDTNDYFQPWEEEPPAKFRDIGVEPAVSAYLAAAQPEVNSVEELDQLPIGSLIMMSGVVAPFLHTDDGWESTRTPGKPVWDYTTNPSYLPARVLYRPEVKP